MRISLVLALLFTLVVLGGISFRGGLALTRGEIESVSSYNWAWGTDYFLGVRYQHELSSQFSLESGIDYARRREAYSFGGEVYQTDFRSDFFEIPVLGVLRNGFMEYAIGGAYASHIENIRGNRADWGVTARIGANYKNFGVFVDAYKWFKEVPVYKWTIVRIGVAYRI